MKELDDAEAQLGGALGRLFALSEAYPDLKANQNMLALQEELTSTENKIGFARQAYNDAVTNYNIRREVFPAVRWPACSASSRRSCSKPQRPSAHQPKCRSSDREPPPLYASHAPTAPLTMATSFFQQQDSARRKTTQLVVYFVLAISILIALVYGLLLWLSTDSAHELVSWWQPERLLFAALGVGLVVGGASVFKVAQLASGGQAVALMLGGEEVPGTTTDARQKRLLNIVEEMALAVGSAGAPRVCSGGARHQCVRGRPRARAMPWSPSPRAASTT